MSEDSSKKSDRKSGTLNKSSKEENKESSDASIQIREQSNDLEIHISKEENEWLEEQMQRQAQKSGVVVEKPKTPQNDPQPLEAFVEEDNKSIFEMDLPNETESQEQ